MRARKDSTARPDRFIQVSGLGAFADAVRGRVEAEEDEKVRELAKSVLESLE